MFLTRDNRQRRNTLATREYVALEEQLPARDEPPNPSLMGWRKSIVVARENSLVVPCYFCESGAKQP